MTPSFLRHGTVVSFQNPLRLRVWYFDIIPSVHRKTNYCITILSAEPLLFPATVTGQWVVRKPTAQLPRRSGLSAGVAHPGSRRTEMLSKSRLSTKTLPGSARETSGHHSPFILPILAHNLDLPCQWLHCSERKGSHIRSRITTAQGIHQTHQPLSIASERLWTRRNSGS